MEIHKDPITDYSQTQRVVLLIDLNPLITLQNPPHRFLDSLLCSAKTLLSFPPLSSSLFAFTFFISSLSPLFSSSKIQSIFPISRSFDHPISALESLSRALDSLSPRIHCGGHSCSSSASFVAASMRQLVHDYAWDPMIDDSISTGTLLNFDYVGIRSSLVVLFSPVPRSRKSLAEFLNVGVDDRCFENDSAFCEKFSEIFANVNDVFVSRDIQFSWVDVRSETIHESGFRFELMMSGIRNLRWGFCTTDSIVLGSALVPFGLIYPNIVMSANCFNFSHCSEIVEVKLILEMVDLAQKSLECKCCGLELVDMNFPRNGSDNNVNIGIELKKKLFSCFGNGVNKFKVKALHKNSEFRKFKWNLSNPILVGEVSLKSGKVQKESHDEFFAEKVLKILSNSVSIKSAPIWQILLTFLYREGYYAMTSISNPNGTCLVGVLKPFTVCTALLFLTDDVPQIRADLSDEISQIAEHSDKEAIKSRRKNSVKHLQDQTWSGFCEAAFGHSELELEEIYFSKQCSDFKRLRFLKTWMKQTAKSGCKSMVLEENSEATQSENKKNVNKRLIMLRQDSEKPTSSASVGEHSLSAASRIQEGEEASRILDAEVVEFQTETSESFFGNLSKKIEQGLESEAVDLGALAQRLVNSSIYWLNKNYDARNSESQIAEPKSQDSTSDSRVAELVRLLLRNPKDLTAKKRSCDTLSQTLEGSSGEKIVRQYELQILFRMEILQSEIGASIGESMKQKFVKQICLLLESIQCRLEGGFFGDWSVDDYVGKIIKARYSQTLDDVIDKIYKKMDLLVFADEQELPKHIFNSEDSNQPLRENPDGDELDGFRSSEPISADDSLHSLEIDSTLVGDHAQKLTEAKARRERARRFKSFTSWIPDLQRVWAPKQPTKPVKPKSDPVGKRPKKKKRREGINDTVCETPVVENKLSQSQSIYDDCNEDRRDKEYGDQSSHSVSKSLFQDDW